MPFRVITAKGGEITPAIIRPKIRGKWLCKIYKKNVQHIRDQAMDDKLIYIRNDD